MKILDVGCHEGIFLKILKDKGYKVLGLEPNTEMVKYGRNMGLSIEQNFIEDFLTDRQFAMVTLFHVIEHLRRPDKVLNFLKPEGYLVLELPNIESYSAKK
ncbi:class I SAM-dependent methyltransferase [bacterium]|nr:class I SAM-dependent methyltransferase [bacterium]